VIHSTAIADYESFAVLYLDIHNAKEQDRGRAKDNPPALSNDLTTGRKQTAGFPLQSFEIGGCATSCRDGIFGTIGLRQSSAHIDHFRFETSMTSEIRELLKGFEPAFNITLPAAKMELEHRYFDSAPLQHI
jgi:hypothetical protein